MESALLLGALLLMCLFLRQVFRDEKAKAKDLGGMFAVNRDQRQPMPKVKPRVGRF